MPQSKTLRDHSRTQYVNSEPTNENINAGSLQRIADACERMAGNYVQMQNELERYRRYYDEKQKKIATLEKKNATLRGVINRLKKNKS